MYTCSADSSLVQGEVVVMLDGLPVSLPATRRSLTGILSHLEMLAMERQRIVFALKIDGVAVNPADPAAAEKFSRLEAQTIDLDEVPLQLLETAAEQTAAAQAEVQSAVALVLINNGPISQELWWKIARKLKDPLLTLSLLPDNSYVCTEGCASLSQLRKWQLQQLAAIVRDVDEFCEAGDTLGLSDVLENRVLKWLNQLQNTITLWRDTISAGMQKDPVA